MVTQGNGSVHSPGSQLEKSHAAPEPFDRTLRIGAV
jgi:hypothetical protein